MHEFSICRNIVAAVIAEYEKVTPAPLRLIAVRIKAGKLHQIVPESLLTAYEVLTKGTIAENSSLEIDFIEIVCKCDNCDWEGEIDYPFFLCKKCGSDHVTIVQGNELYLENLEIEEDEK
jgi:hydrogenase nickel incorporation protein HypA/HybF